MEQREKKFAWVWLAVLGGALLLIPSRGWAQGIYALQLGLASSASGPVSVTLGYGSVSSGQDSMALGVVSTASGYYGVALGGGSLASGTQALALGFLSSALGDDSTAAGWNSTSQGQGQFTVGQFNVLQGDLHNWIATDNLFIVGNGTDATHRSNAFVINKNGDTEIGGQLKVDGSIRTAPHGDLSMGAFTTGPTP